ncbi:MAG TPA: phage terminase large subunit [Methylovorus sp.]|nr:phage terminase large subunit [Methylovorus sp.]
MGNEAQQKPKAEKVSLLVFFVMWAKRMRWDVPDIHVQALVWLENKGELAVLRCFRGFGKSTLLAIYNAWRYYKDPTFRILHQSEADPTAYKTSRDTRNVLRNHPLTKHLLPPGQGTVEQWWVNGSNDSRNASMYAKGILSNVTSARADECQNDDVEVPRNIQTPEAREKLRSRLDEQTHILVPGGSKLYIGTPHTHDSLYDEIEAMGADCLTIRMYGDEYRIEAATARVYRLPFIPEVVFSGIGKRARVLREGLDYSLSGTTITFVETLGCLIDFYARPAWPGRFSADELEKRRGETRTINAWDSQYQLHSKPVTQVRLNPEGITPYDAKPFIRKANGEITMWLGKVQIVSATAKWDPSSGKLNSDISSFSVMLQDDTGRMYWHKAVSLEGDLALFDDAGRVIGGQVWQICDIIQELQLPRVVIESNGVGTNNASILRGAMKARNIQCGITEIHETRNKNRKILAAFEPALSGNYLWAHVDVLEEVWEQMRDFNPAITTNADDHLDSGAGAMEGEPVRIGKIVGNPTDDARQDWRPRAGVAEVTFET